MIRIKSPAEAEAMRAAGRLAAKVLNYTGSFVKPGVTTQELNDIAHEFTIRNGALSAPLNYKGFPRSICTSINEVVCHGIPSDKVKLRDGDIVNLDITVKLDGWHGDTSRTFFVGEVKPHIREFVGRVEAAMYEGIKAVRPGAHISDIGARIARYLRPFGYGIVTALGGHGIGRNFHEEPFVFHHKQKERGPKIRPGMTFTVEPMINMGRSDVYVDSRDGWTVFTSDNSLSAQFEHTVLVTDVGVEILTRDPEAS